MGLDGVNWIHLAEDRGKMTGCCEYSNETLGPYKAGNLLTSWGTVRLSRTTLLRGVGSFLFHGATAPSGPGPPHHRGFTTTLRHTTLGRTPLYEWPARRRDFYLITHNTHKRQTSVPPAAFEPTIPASERPLTHAFRPRGHWDRRSWKLVLLNASYFTGIFSRWITYCFVLLNGVSVACVTYHRALNSSKICKLLFLFKHHVLRCIRSTGVLIPSEWNVFDRVLTHSSAASCCDRY